MEVLVTMKVNDGKTGELLQVERAFFTCDECKDLDEFDEKHGDEIEEFLENSIHPDNLTGDYVTRLDLVELADEPAEVA